ncbi:MAG: RpiB/LacA/LacB family sugar-phosphate isomerase [Patescibacteria group bacterium]
MKIFIGADHRGFELKEKLKSFLQTEYEMEDCGSLTYEQTDDASDYASKVALKVLENPESLGIVICGSGAAVDIAANRYKGVRCGLGFDVSQIEHMRGWDHINVLALPSDNLDLEKAKSLVKAFLETELKQEERMIRRIKKLDEIEN